MPDEITTPPAPHDPGTLPSQRNAIAAISRSKPAVYALLGGLGLFMVANTTNLMHGAHRETPKSALPVRPSAPNAQQVSSFSTQQSLLTQRDEETRIRQEQLKAQMEQLQQEQAVPGPESPGAQPMTAAQRQAIYGDSPNAPAKTSNVSQAHAEAKQRALAREKQHRDALNSDTVAIDFARSAGAGNTAPAGTAEASASTASADAEPGPADIHDGPASTVATSRPVAEAGSSPSQEPTASKDPMAFYGFDEYQGRLYRICEGTVFEGVVTNHIDGGFSGPIIVMLTTDYYSHDHQQLLLPQGTRLIGNVQSVGSTQQRKLFVVFNRAVCPDGFSIDLNKFIGLDPIGTTGLATGVNNHYLSSFAAAAAVGGLGGLAQIGNSGSVLDSSTQIRNGVSGQTAQEGEQILNHFLNRLPVITVKEGSRARVYINRDILIPSYAEHRVDPTL